MTRGTQQRIRDAALGLLIAEGVPGFSIDEICRRSGIAKTTIWASPRWADGGYDA